MAKGDSKADILRKTGRDLLQVQRRLMAAVKERTGSEARELEDLAESVRKVRDKVGDLVLVSKPNLHHITTVSFT